jgi:hypothetical protein
MVCVFGVCNVPSTGRSSTFEYWKRKKPASAEIVAQLPSSIAEKNRKPGDFSPGFQIQA